MGKLERSGVFAIRRCGWPVELKSRVGRLKQGVARRLIGDADHFWQKRYHDFNVRNHA